MNPSLPDHTIRVPPDAYRQFANYNNRPWTISLVGKWEPELCASFGIPWHLGIYAERTGTIGVLYDIHGRGDSVLLQYLGFGSTALNVKPTSHAVMVAQGYKMLTIAKHSDILFTLYSFSMAGASVSLTAKQTIPLTLPFGYFAPIPPWALNCTVWTATSAILAVTLSLLPV
jgi:hypothetical protein